MWVCTLAVEGVRMGTDKTVAPGPNTLRDHLANERTFLAWMRTAIAIVALGFVVAKFSLLLREESIGKIHTTTIRWGAVVGVLLVFGGTGAAGLATAKFMQVRRDIDRNVVQFRPALDLALAAVIGVTGLLLAGYIIATS
jgi:uncharacterized membrane protein YidH (DUF202 family)